MNKQFGLEMREKTSCSRGFSFLDFKRVFAFTLAETLIVIGIIGVVAALTLPNLNSSTGDKEAVAQVKKLYQNISEAVGRAQVVYGPYRVWVKKDNSDSDRVRRVASRITEFMKISKDCGTSSSSCFATNIKNLYGNEAGYVNEGGDDAFYYVKLADGSSLAIKYYGSYTFDYVFVDIDGPNKGPNTASIDIFAFTIDRNTGVVKPYGAADSDSTLLTCGCYDNGDVECTAWVVMHDNMDYLNVNSNGYCKNNSSIYLDGTTNTTCK